MQRIYKIFASIILLGSTLFVLTTTGLMIALLTGKSTNDFFLDANGESNVDSWRFTFWLVVFSIFMLKVLGGRIRNISVIHFPYKVDD